MTFLEPFSMLSFCGSRNFLRSLIVDLFHSFAYWGEQRSSRNWYSRRKIVSGANSLPVIFSRFFANGRRKRCIAQTKAPAFHIAGHLQRNSSVKARFYFPDETAFQKQDFPRDQDKFSSQKYTGKRSRRRGTGKRIAFAGFSYKMILRRGKIRIFSQRPLFKAFSGKNDKKFYCGRNCSLMLSMNSRRFSLPIPVVELVTKYCGISVQVCSISAL